MVLTHDGESFLLLVFKHLTSFLLRNYFAGIPKEIEEAAIIDGATEFQILGKNLLYQ